MLALVLALVLALELVLALVPVQLLVHPSTVLARRSSCGQRLHRQT